MDQTAIFDLWTTQADFSYLTLDDSGRITSASLTIEQFLGQSPSQIEGLSLANLLIPVMIRRRLRPYDAGPN